MKEIQKLIRGVSSGEENLVPEEQDCKGGVCFISPFELNFCVYTCIYLKINLKIYLNLLNIIFTKI